MALSVKEQLINGINAVKLSQKINKEISSRPLLSEEIKIFDDFKGWGGIKALLHPIDEDWKTSTNVAQQDKILEQPIKDFYEYLKVEYPQSIDKIWNSIKLSVLTSFFTPSSFTENLLSEYKRSTNAKKINSFLDPSSGSGVFISSLEKVYQKEFSSINIFAVEKDFLTSAILKARFRNYSNVKVINKPFEKINFSQKFDLIASNIPFGNFSIYHTEYDRDVTSKIHNFFMFHSANLLNDNGNIMFLSSTGLMNSKNNQSYREKLSQMIAFEGIITLPNNLYQDSGTEVTSHLITATKKPKEWIHQDNQQFIESVKDDSDIFLNQHIVNNFQKSFIKNPKIDTNPYGEKEYNYQLAEDEIKTFINNKLNFNFIDEDKLETKSTEIITYDEITKMDIENLKSIFDYVYFLREPIDTTKYQENTYKPIAVIKINDKGVLKPVATVSRCKNIRKIKEYNIDYYIQHPSLKNKGFLSNKLFKEEFQNFCQFLENFCQEKQHEISLTHINDEDGVAFKGYMYDRFEQPFIDTIYRARMENIYHHHKPLSNGMISIFDGELVKIENLLLDEDDIEILELKRNLFSSDRERVLMEDYFKLYSQYNFFISNEQNLDKNKKEELDLIKTSLKALNTKYDDFVKNYGFINDNKKIILKYDQFYFSILSTLENKTEESIDLFSTKKSYTKADIFDFENLEQSIIDTSIYSSEDALIKTVNETGFSIDINKLVELTKKEEAEILEDLESRISFNPLLNAYQLKEIFASGNIYQKIEDINHLENFSDETKKTAVDELKKYIPEIIPFHNIHIQFGARWFPTELYIKFINQFYNSTFEIVKNIHSDGFNVSCFNEGDGFLKQKCENGRTITPIEIIENAYFGNFPIVKYSITHDDGTKEYFTDLPATNFYKREIKRLQKGFDNYLNALENDIQDSIVKLYNRQFNNIHIENINGDLLTYEEMNLSNMNIPEMYAHQKDAIVKGLINKGGLFDHEVGFGKTLTMCGLAHQMKKLKVINKPIILGLKANVPELAETYQKLFPNAKVLFAKSKDYTAKNREMFLNRIKNNNWDIVVMSHEQFKSIPQDSEVMIDVFQQELSDVEDNLLALNRGEYSKQQKRGLEIKKNNLINSLTLLKDEIEKQKSENVLTFKSLGIDHIIVDESHKYKNLAFQTRHSRVAGLGNQAGNQSTLNMLTAIRTIQKKQNNDFGASFFSGTPISNSLTELYSIQKYLVPQKLQNSGLSNFDSWASNFVVKDVDFETNVLNDIISKERFRYFVNLPELSLMYNEMAHIMNGSLVKMDRPEKNVYLLESQRTPLNERFYVKLRKFLDRKDTSVLETSKPIQLDKKGNALSIIAMNMAFKASIDMRLVNEHIPDEKNSKINKMVQEVVNTYHQFDEQKGTQIIFSDLGTSKKKLTYAEMKNNYENNVFTSIYDDIKYKLITAGIKEEEIAFVQDWSSQRRKVLLNEKMNSGAIRVLIGGTENAGTGLNVQKRLVAIRHLTIPWKPSELEQRNGRGYRKGNEICKKYNDNKIDISISSTKKTLDVYKININKTKQFFIDQLRSSTIDKSIRVIDEGAMSEETGMNLAEMQAVLSGDNTLLEKTKIDKQIKQLEDEKGFIVSSVYSAQKKIEKNTHLIENKNEVVRYLKNANELYEQALVKNNEGEFLPIKPHFTELKSDATDKEIFAYLKDVHQQIDGENYKIKKNIGEIAGFDIIAENSFFEGVKFYAQTKSEPIIKLQHNRGKLTLSSANRAVEFFDKCLKTIQNRLGREQKNLSQLLEETKEFEKNIHQKFDKEKELDELKKQSEFLFEKIKENSKTTQKGLEKVSVKLENEQREIPKVSKFSEFKNAVLNEWFNTKLSTFALIEKNISKNLQYLENDNFQVQNTIDYNEDYDMMKFLIESYDNFYVDICENEFEIINLIKSKKNQYKL